MVDLQKDPWTFLSTVQQYDNPWITVREDQVIKPRGGSGIYGVVHFKNLAIGVVALDAKGQITLVGQYRYPIKKYSWELPEGGCPQGEAPLEAAKRELLEETGLEAAEWALLLEMDLSNSVTDEHCLVFLASGLEQYEARPEDTEVLQIKTVSLDKAMEKVLSGDITDAITVAALLKLKILKPQLF